MTLHSKICYLKVSIASIKLKHSWSKLHDIYEVLVKDFELVRENHKKSGNHDDFINFCDNKSEVYYLYLWLQEKPDLQCSSMWVAWYCFIWKHV